MMEDPRTISTSLEILFVAKAIERIGDHAKNMSEYVVYMVKGRDVRHVTVEEIEREVQRIIRSCATTTILAAVDLGSNSFRLQIARVENDQLYMLDGLREAGASGRRTDRRQTPRQGCAATRAGLSATLWRTAARSAARGGARGRYQLPARGQECPRIPAAGRSRARFSHRCHRRTRRSASHLSRRRTWPAAIGRQTHGDGYRRRLHRIHHRQRPAAAQAGKPVHGLRQLQRALFSRRQDQQIQPQAGRTRRAQRSADHRLRVFRGPLG